MKQDKFLPIGTVVMLKGGKKRIMISGFLASTDTKKIYDYSGCLYPEGFLSSEQICLFNHEEIDKIYYIGYQDDEAKEFTANLLKLEKQINENS